MRDQFAGDFHDFWKYLFLQFVDREFGSVGICWMKTPDLKITHGNNRRHESDEFRKIEPDLVREMEKIKEAKPSIAAVKKSILPFATDFGEQFPKGDATRHKNDRKAYFGNAAIALAPRSFVFIDPDNGLSLKLKRPTERHILIEEISIFSRNQIKIVYHHFNREAAHIDQIALIMEMVSAHHYSARFIKFIGIPAGVLLLSEYEQEPEIDKVASNFTKKYLSNECLKNFVPNNLEHVPLSRSHNSQSDNADHGQALGKLELLVDPNPQSYRIKKQCPICDQPFEGAGWTGIDAHWESKHKSETNISYNEISSYFRDKAITDEDRKNIIREKCKLK